MGKNKKKGSGSKAAETAPTKGSDPPSGKKQNANGSLFPPGTPIRANPSMEEFRHFANLLR